MKRVFKLVLSSLALVSLIACGNETSSNDSSKVEESSTSGSALISSSKQESSNSVSSNSSDGSITSSIPQEVYYHVTFQNYDGKVLEEVDVLEGDEAVYSGKKPERKEEDGYIYTFIGWDQPLTNIRFDLITKAVYSQTADNSWGPINF